MHVLQLPPRNIWSVTVLSALLAILVTALVFVVSDARTPSGTSGAGASSTSVPTESVRPPLAPPTVFNQPLTRPLERLGMTS